MALSPNARIKQAMDALCDWRVPPEHALELWKQTFGRSNLTTQRFALHVGGACRIAGEEYDALDRWQNEGGR